jgi:hypothetical protein
MSQRPLDILQRTRNKIDTAYAGWSEFANACTAPYETAYKLHQDALTAVKEEFKARDEALWGVLSLLLGGLVKAWVPRLLAPVHPDSQLDALTNAWVKDALTNTGKEVQGLIQGTILGKMKDLATGGTNDEYAPVVESTVVTIGRLKAGVDGRARRLLGAVDKLIDNPAPWTVSAATMLENGFSTSCPFVTDEPVVGKDFDNSFAQKAELGMWVSWGLARKETWWRKQESQILLSQGESMYTIANRLSALGVPLDAISTVGQIGVYQRRGRIFDMVKFIEWAKWYDLTRQSADRLRRIPLPEWLKVRRDPNRSYVGEGVP